VNSARRAHWLAYIVPAALLAGAWGSQLFGGLQPCEMCHWQRWPHYGAAAIALLAFMVTGTGAKRALVLIAALCILASGLVGVFHAGVEYKWWDGITPCSALPGAGGGDLLKNIMNAPLISCDQPQWTLFGISLAGYNAIISILGALSIFTLALRKDA
jgi:disulfide bond formation protein DsbB